MFISKQIRQQIQCMHTHKEYNPNSPLYVKDSKHFYIAKHQFSNKIITGSYLLNNLSSSILIVIRISGQKQVFQ